MRNFLCTCLILVIIAGCKSKIPANIIEPTKIEAVLYDIHIVDAYIATIPNQDSAKRVASAFYKGIYKKFGIDSAAYKKSMNFYSDHPDLLGDVYNKVMASLKKSKDSVDKIEAKRIAKIAAAEKKVKDAIAKKTKDSLDKVELKKKLKALPAKRLKDSLEKAELKKKARAASIKFKKDSLNKADRLKKAAKVSVKKIS